MAKVLVRYGIHPEERARFAAAFIQHKYRGNPLVKFKRFPFHKTVEGQILQAINKTPSIIYERNSMDRAGRITEACINEQDTRVSLNRKAFKEGFCPIEIHSTPRMTVPAIFYSNEFEIVAVKLKQYLQKKGYVIDLEHPADTHHGPVVGFEFPGKRTKSSPLSRLLFHIGGKYRYGHQSNRPIKQTLEQLRLSKNILKESIDFLTKNEIDCLKGKKKV